MKRQIAIVVMIILSLLVFHKIGYGEVIGYKNIIISSPILYDNSSKKLTFGLDGDFWIAFANYGLNLKYKPNTANLECSFFVGIGLFDFFQLQFGGSTSGAITLRERCDRLKIKFSDNHFFNAILISFIAEQTLNSSPGHSWSLGVGIGITHDYGF